MQSNGRPPARSADELQKQEVSKVLQIFIDNPYAIKDLGWAWNRILAPVAQGSSFDQSHRSASVALSILLRHNGFDGIRRRRSIPQHAIFLVDDSGRLYFSFHNVIGNNERPGTAYVSPQDISAEVAGLAGFAEDLSLLASMARLTGGWITSSEQMVVGQWLRTQALQLPDNEEDTRELLDLLNFSTLPDAPAYGNYWQLLNAPEDSPFKLDEQRRAIILQVTTEQTAGNSLLIESFGNALIFDSVSDTLLASRSYRLQKLIDTSLRASNLCAAYFEALEWFTAGSDSKASVEFMAQLMIAVLILELDPNADAANTHFAGFDLYSKAFFDRHPSWVHGKLAAHLTGRFGFNPQLAPQVSDVLAELVLGGMAPEYLFAQWPAELRIGTPGWVIGTQAVHFAEALIPGVTRNMTYQALLAFGQSVKAMPTLAALHATHSIDPVVTWALMNELISRDAEGNVSQEAMTRATQEYAKYLDQILKAAKTFSIPLPHRKPLALKELKSTAPDCDPAERLVKHRGTGGGGGAKVPVIDLYLGDELHTQDWDRVKGTSIYTSFPELLELFPVSELYEEAIAGHFTGMTEALASNIEIALSQLHPYVATYIEHGALGIYCVQKYVVNPGHTSTARPGVIVRESASPGETGRYGVIICAQLHDDLRCFELFPMRMECRYNPELAQVFRPLVSQDFAGQDTKFADRERLEGVPVDMQAYLQNSTQQDGKKSRLFVRKIGEFKAPVDDADPAYPAPFFRSSRKEALGKLIAEENPYLTEKELSRIGLDQTERERAIEKTDAIFNTLLNLIIPFKECVEGLTSGDPKRQQLAIVDCVVDAAVLALSFAAVPGKIAATSTKASAVASKLLSASRVLGGTARSLFNPLDGFAQLLKGGGKLLGRGVGKLSGHALSGARTARQQLRHLTGANSYDLIKAINHTGSASRIRMSLDTVAHGRALFKSDLIENADQVFKHLHANDTKLLAKVPEEELAQLLENTLANMAQNSDSARSLNQVLSPPVVESLIRQQARKYNLDQLYHFSDYTVLPELFDTTLKIEYKNLTFMQGHHDALITRDLRNAPFDSLLDEVKFNPGGLTDNADRAAAWILNASNSPNELDAVKKLLLEFSANSKPLNDPAVYAQLHHRFAPRDPGGFRSPTGEARYPSNVSGAALLEKHAARLDPASEHFAKQMLGAMLGYHAFVDGNGRTARALYAIAELRQGRFNALAKSTEDALSGLS